MPTGQPDSNVSPQERSDREVRDVYHVDRIIREAMKAGSFDDLPGTGKPIPGAGNVDDEMWWVRSWVERNRPPDDQASSSTE